MNIRDGMMLRGSIFDRDERYRLGQISQSLSKVEQLTPSLARVGAISSISSSKTEKLFNLFFYEIDEYEVG